MKNIIFVCEYWNGEAWIIFGYSKDLERCKRNLDMPIFGDPKTRLAKYEVSGKKWKFLEVVK